MSFLFPKPQKPQPLPALPTREDPAIQERLKEERLKRKRRLGLGQTILTAGLGDTLAPVDRPTLLGQAGAG